MDNKYLYITGGNSGNIIKYKISTKTVEFDTSLRKVFDFKWLMGILRYNGLYVSSNNRIFHISNTGKIKKSKKYPHNYDFHHMRLINGKLFSTATSFNKICVLNKDSLKSLDTFVITPPNSAKRVTYGKNYNHINNIIFYKDKYYVNLNWLNDKQFGYSGVAVFDKDFKEVDRFKYGWQSHTFNFIEDKKWCLCGYSNKSNKVHHPKVGGLFVDNVLEFKDKGDFFFKDFSVDDKYIYLVGGQTAERSNRDKVDGKIIILDRDFNVVSETRLEKSGALTGCVLDKYDYTKVNT